MRSPLKPLRGAIYTGVSTEHGLEQEFNSLAAQREACEAYITSQKHEGWRLTPTRYDDGGFLRVRLRADALLLGRIFDDRGKRMTPTHANKGGACYRYYTSCVLAQGRRGEAGSVPRMPASEIEILVLKALRPGQRGGTETKAEPASEIESIGLIERDVDRVVIRKGTLEIWHVQEEGAEPRPALMVPWSPVLRRRRSLITDPEQGGVSSRPTRAESGARLVEGIGKARRWLDELASGKLTGTGQIAKQEGCSERSVRMILNLAFLSPGVVRGAVAGTLPNASGVSRLTEAPVSWKDQMDLLITAARGQHRTGAAVF